MLFVRTAFFTALWIAVAFVFAAEIYLSERTGPLHISWISAIASAFGDWCPWFLLTPIAVILAGQFRFERHTWKRSLAVHIVACLVFAFIYEGLLLLTYRQRPISGAIYTTRVESPSKPAGVSISTNPIGPPAPLPFLTNSNGAPLTGFGNSPSIPPIPDEEEEPPETAYPKPLTGSVLNSLAGDDSSHLAAPAKPARVARAPLPPLFETDANGVTVVAFGRPSSLAQTNGGVPEGFPQVRPHNKWIHFLQMAVLRTQFTVPIYCCIVCICWVTTHFQETRAQERRALELEARLTQANLQALKMQLQPHFLFNALNAISSLIHENPEAADEMVGSLSQFLRMTLDMSSENEVPLRKELDFVTRYLEIQQVRFGDRLRVCREVDLQNMNALVPPLILQPLVENAIRYGIESRELGGTVTIRAVREGDVLKMEVTDDGEGFKEMQLRSGRAGIGLSNTRHRLQELYGDKHQFRLTSNHPTGACVKLEIPFTLAPTESWSAA